MSIGVEEGEDWIRIYNNGSVSAAHVKTLPYPGFPTDMQPQITVLLSRADGTSKIVEGVTDFRFQYTEELKRMGADITVNGKMAMVSGPKSLKGTIVRAPIFGAAPRLLLPRLWRRAIRLSRTYSSSTEDMTILSGSSRASGQESYE